MVYTEDARRIWSVLGSTLFLVLYFSHASARAVRESYIPEATRPVPAASLPPAEAYHCPDCKRLSGYFLTISGGPLNTSNEKAETIILRPNVSKTYTANTNNSGYATGEIFWGYERIIEEGMFGQFGLAVAYTNTKVKGDIWEDANPNFNDFAYQYNTNRVRIAAKGKLVTNLVYDFGGYLSGSAGFAVNKANSFSITSRMLAAVPAPAFRSNSEIGFSYTLGLGLEKPFSSSWRGGVGYEFADWGPSSLDRAPGQSLNNGLGMSHLYTHAILFSLTFLG